MRVWHRVALGLLATATVACSDEETTGPSTQDLVGTWHVTKMEFVNVANSANVIEAIALGATATVQLELDHSYLFTVSFPGVPTETETGTWSASSDVMTLIRSGTQGTWQFEMILTGHTMLLNGADTQFDFNLDGVEEPAKLNLEMTKP